MVAGFGHIAVHLNIEGPFKDVFCSSITTIVKTETSFLLIGRVFQLANCSEVAIEDQQQVVAFGPWHGYIHRRTFDIEAKSKDELLFISNLQNQLSNVKFSDHY